MSSWTEVINYVRTRYEVLEESDTWLRFRMDTDGSRSQQVSVHHVPDDDGEWLEISSPVGWADQVDLRRLLELAGSATVGGVAVVDGVALLKHTVPVEDLSVREEFERPLKLVVAHADSFERELAGTDHF
ncbi:CesT family type III secretion system chaperone [Kibdelosporangium persicum]|uniref:CesT family type III secretion system chaperone n=1 Tax=Kibdelosporangium persicum TaxID=2698649 RepID=UPI00156401C2|nr:CesT family type III secretion system chaperone [Kibdelosporangium persicum]